MTVALVAELLYRAPPSLDVPAVLAHVRRTLPDTELDEAGGLLVHAGFGAGAEWLPLSTAQVLAVSPLG
jgi:hypothetical protein